MDADLNLLVENTGVALPLAARITRVILESGASLIEANTALSLVSRFVDLLPLTLIADGVSSPELKKQA